jgi:chlorobactene glucosyltransferase
MYLALVFISFFWVYLLIDIGRLFRGRINKEYLKHAWRQTAVWLIGFQIVVVLMAALAVNAQITLLHGLYFLGIAQLFFSCLIFVSYRQNARSAAAGDIKLALAEKDYPTLSVCIPARNETVELEECLKSLIASKYPKLEILVLDDQSQERRTSEIIRDFAHDGVRFIAGEAPPAKWLAKNYAYEQLAEQANGELLFFCGVDCRFEPDSLTNLVRFFKQSSSSMLSLLPINIPLAKDGLAQTLIQPSRYAWELALPRQLTNRPPVLSTAWLADSERLRQLGGFGAVSHKVVPESYFAKEIARKDNSYKFVISNGQFGLSAKKSVAEQRETAIRTRYPQLHRRPEFVALISLAELTQLLLPIFMVIFALLTSNLFLSLVSGLTVIGNATVYSQLVNLTYQKLSFAGVFALPFAVVYDICLLNYSMWQYEFGEVRWKERSIAFPVMQTFPSLPKLED